MEIKARLSRIISEEMREREQQEAPSSYNVNVRINYLDLHLASTDLFKVQKLHTTWGRFGRWDNIFFFAHGTC